MAKSSKEYWADRERENLEKNLKAEAEYFREIEDIYKYTMASTILALSSIVSPRIPACR